MFKVIQRNRDNNRQQKKRIYETTKSFNIYAFDVCSRYVLWYKVEVYEQQNEEWVLIAEFQDQEEFYKIVKEFKEGSTFLKTLKEYND